MNAIQKATAAAVALTITLVGATLATAPLTLPASTQQGVSRAYHWSSSHHHVLAAGQRAAVSTVQVG